MSMGFQITQEDVEVVLGSYNATIPSDMEEIMSIIDDVEISEAALSVDVDSDEDEEEVLMKQTEVAYDEIAWQLYQEGYITKKQIKLYGNTDLLHRTQEN